MQLASSLFTIQFTVLSQEQRNYRKLASCSIHSIHSQLAISIYRITETTKNKLSSQSFIHLSFFSFYISNINIIDGTRSDIKQTYQLLLRKTVARIFKYNL